MPSRKQIKGVLHNFLGTLASRNSDRHGYWIFGFVVESAESLEIDLLQLPQYGHISPDEDLAFLAVTRFRDQLNAAHVPLASVQRAFLFLKRGDVASVVVNSTRRQGWRVTLVARATTDRGGTHECSKTLFVAAHDPRRELKSTRRAPIREKLMHAGWRLLRRVGVID